MCLFVCSKGRYSKSFGESTPHREACRAYRSPNSPISPRLVKAPPLQGPARHIAHQTIWNKASESSTSLTKRFGTRLPKAAHCAPNDLEQGFQCRLSTAKCKFRLTISHLRKIFVHIDFRTNQKLVVPLHRVKQ